MNWSSIQITDQPIRADALLEGCSDPAAGGVAIFLGTTRDETSPQGRQLKALEYEAYIEMAEAQLHNLAATAGARWPILKLSMIHRMGTVPVGETSVAIVVATPHRADAFAACQWLIDSLKADVAIWKKEVWDDGSATWVHP